MMRKIGLLVIILCISPFPSDASEKAYPEIRAVVTPDAVTVGGVVEYKVTIAGENLKGIEVMDPDKKIYYPPAEEREGKQSKQNKKDEDAPSRDIPLYIIHSAEKKNSSAEEMTYITLVMKISYYRPGKYRLPEIEIRDEEKIKIGYRIPEIKVNAVNKDARFEEIEPPLDLGGNYYRVVFLVLGAVLLTLAAVFFYKYIKKRRMQRVEPSAYVPPIEEFLKNLDKLDCRELIKRGEIEEYVTGMSMIFRRFLSGLIKIDAMEMTSDEIDKNLRKYLTKYIYGKYGDKISKSFDLWDLSKFAEFAPSEEILMDNYDNTRKLAVNLSKDLDNGISGV